jgi:hypothetical protein
MKQQSGLTSPILVWLAGQSPFLVWGPDSDAFRHCFGLCFDHCWHFCSFPSPLPHSSHQGHKCAPSSLRCVSILVCACSSEIICHHLMHCICILWSAIFSSCSFILDFVLDAFHQEILSWLEECSTFGLQFEFPVQRWLFWFEKNIALQQESQIFSSSASHGCEPSFPLRGSHQ